MSNFFNIKKLLSDTKKVLIIVLCGITLIANIALFTFLSAAFILPSFVSIITSNIISIIITFVIYKPISKIIEEEMQSQLKDEISAQRQILEEKAELESQLKFQEQKARERELEISRLKSELDTALQYKSISNNSSLVLKLETMIHEKEGYVVKSENVRSTLLGQDISKSASWNPLGKDKGDQKVLYVKKFHEKAIIGIDLEAIRFCRHNGQIYIEGLEMHELHGDLYPRDNNETSYDNVKICEILNMGNNGRDIIGMNTDTKYDNFKGRYANEQDELFLRSFRKEVEQKCTAYTSIMRQNLHMKFPTIQFVDCGIEQIPELAGEPIHLMKLNKDYDILEVSSSIYMIANTMNQLNQ